AHMSQHWAEVHSEYERAMARIAPTLRQSLLRTDAYLHLLLGGFAGRSMAIYIELAAPINTVNVRSNQDSYSVVMGDSAAPRVDDIRHAYLHFQLDGVVATNLTKIQNNAQLLALVKKADGVEQAYTSEGHVLVTESLIRAPALGIDRAPPSRDLLKEGEGAFNAGDIGKAETAFQKVLSDFDRENGAAIYGLALIASKNEDRQAAQQYFERAIRSQTAEPSMKVWSYIY